MRYRLAVWAALGFFVAAFWGVYFATANKELPIDPIVSFLARLTCPIGVLGSYFAISLWWALVANLATYAVLGFTVETLRRRFTHPR